MDRVGYTEPQQAVNAQLALPPTGLRISLSAWRGTVVAHQLSYLSGGYVLVLHLNSPSSIVLSDDAESTTNISSKASRL